MLTSEPTVSAPRELTAEEGAELFDGTAQRMLGMSGEEFLRRWDAGTLDDPTDPRVFHVALLIPLVR